MIVASVLLVLAALRQPRFLSIRPLVLLGLVSYGVYLWQSPVVSAIHLVRLPWPLVLVLVLVVSTAIAGLSFYFVERRFRSPPSAHPRLDAKSRVSAASAIRNVPS
jgi:peptidoglycan/LPS O-acetylase OafA/YrhL